MGGRAISLAVGAVASQFDELLLVEYAARVSCIRPAEVGVGTGQATAAIVLEPANGTVSAAVVAVAAKLPQPAEEKLAERLVTQVAVDAVRHIDARRQVAVRLDTRIGPAGPAPAEITSNDAGLETRAPARMAARDFAFERRKGQRNPPELRRGGENAYPPLLHVTVEHAKHPLALYRTEIEMRHVPAPADGYEVEMRKATRAALDGQLYHLLELIDVLGGGRHTN